MDVTDESDFSADELRIIVRSPRYKSCRIVVDPTDEGGEQRLLEFAIVDNLNREITFCGPAHYIVRHVTDAILELDARSASVKEGI